MGSNHPVQVIAVTGGKGGIGKTNVSVNLSLALADMGRRVVLLDADLGLANVDVLLGLKPKATLADVLDGKCDLRDVMVTGPGGIRIVPAASGAANMVSLSPQQHAGLIQAFSEIGDNIDVLVVDTAAGIGDSVVSFVRAAQEALIVVCDEPTSITDAYALIKLLNRDHGMTRFRVLANMVGTPQEGRMVFAKLATQVLVPTALTDLSRSLHHWGSEGGARRGVKAARHEDDQRRKGAQHRQQRS